MDINLGKFKYVFFLESLYGTSTVSLDTLKQSKWKVAYAGFHALVYILWWIIYLYSKLTGENSETNAMLMYRIIINSLPMFSLISGLYDHKTKISNALNLEAIHQRLESHGFNVSENFVWKYFHFGLVASQLSSQIFVLALFVIHPPQKRSLLLTAIHYITWLQYNGTQMLQCSALLAFLTKALIIQRTITKSILSLSQGSLENIAPRPSASRRCQHRSRRIHTAFSDLTEERKKWVLLTELQGTLNSCEYNIWSTFRFSVIWYCLLVGMVLSVLVAPFSHNVNVLALYNLALKCSCLLSIVVTAERVRCAKQDAFHQLGRCRKSSNSPRHQLLANIHRGRRSFCCVLFDVNYDLLYTILEYSMLVVTTIFGYD